MCYLIPKRFRGARSDPVSGGDGSLPVPEPVRAAPAPGHDRRALQCDTSRGAGPGRSRTPRAPRPPRPSAPAPREAALPARPARADRRALRRKGRAAAPASHDRGRDGRRAARGHGGHGRRYGGMWDEGCGWRGRAVRCPLAAGPVERTGLRAGLGAALPARTCGEAPPPSPFGPGATGPRWLARWLPTAGPQRCPSGVTGIPLRAKARGKERQRWRCPGRWGYLPEGRWEVARVVPPWSPGGRRQSAPRSPSAGLGAGTGRGPELLPWGVTRPSAPSVLD